MALPLSGSNVYLLESVPFTNTYKHTRHFTSRTEQFNYFNSRTKSHTMTQANYQRISGRYHVMVDKHIDSLWQTNYLMFQNSQYTNKWFYCFVTDMEYVNKGVTRVFFEVDVFQTWFLDTTFKQSYVIREHCPLWNADGTPVLNTVDEGLDYGSEYDIMSFNQVKPSNGLLYLVIVAKSLIHNHPANDDVANEIKPSLNGQPQPLAFYVHPFLADGSSPQCNFNLSSIDTVLKGLYSQDDAVNNIVSLYVTDHIGVNISYTAGSQVTFPTSTFRGVSVADDSSESFSTIYCYNLPAYSTVMKTVESDKYADFGNVTESKLLMYPYTVLTLDDFKGNRQDYKLEYVNGKSLNVAIRGSLGTSNKVTYSIPQYNTGNLESNDASKVSVETGIIGNATQDVPIITDMLAAYMQGNRNSLQTQQSSIVFNGVMGAAGSAGSMVGGNPVGGAMDAVSGLGNTVLQLQAMDSKVKDINNTPPSISKMGSNTYWDFGHGYNGLFVIKKQIKPEYRRKLESFFKMYGYKVGRLKMPNLRTRSNWNYVQTQECSLVGGVPQDDMVRLKKVFDDGITLWHTNDIGNYSLENGVR